MKDNVTKNIETEQKQGNVFDPSTASQEQINFAISKLNEPLNAEQKIAAEQTEGPLIVVAGAGAGKTKTVIHRVATMLLKGIPASNIMVVTFTNKAAAEIKERLEAMIGENGQYVHAGTFHAIIFREILKPFFDCEYLKKLNIDMSECSIMDDSESLSLLRESIKELDENDRKYISEEVGDKNVIKIMSEERAEGNDVFDFSSRIIAGSRFEKRNTLISNIWAKYEQKCREVNGMDFDDILVHASKMLKKEHSIAEQLSEKFKYIMLDEYQDTNNVQMAIMDTIAQYHKNICVVGDEKQSIYKFRGANVQVMMSFEKRFSNVKQIDMNKNYRSYSEIIKYSNALASCMDEKLSDGQLNFQRQVSENNEDFRKRKLNSVAMVEFPNAKSEASALRKAITRDLSLGIQGNQVAVLYRNRSLKAEIERELIDYNIPYYVFGDKSFYQKAEVKDAIALLRFIFHPWDSIAGLRVLKASSMRVSPKSAKEAMSKSGINVSEFLRLQSEKRLKTKKKGQTEPDLTASALKISPFIKISKMLRDCVDYGDDPVFIRDVIAKIWDIYLKPGFENKNDKNTDSNFESDNKLENVQQVFKRFKEALEENKKISEIIEDLQMQVENNADLVDSKNKVQLLTMHASKGLEYENVYIIGLDNITTHGKEEKYDEIEESRRVLYVGMTRAQKKLSISYGLERVLNGSRIKVNGSPFIDEIEQKLNIKRFSLIQKRSKALEYA